jgi:hypothetical protein
MKRTSRRIRAKILPPQKQGKTSGARHRLVMREDEPQSIEDGSIQHEFFQDDGLPPRLYGWHGPITVAE